MSKLLSGRMTGKDAGIFLVWLIFMGFYISGLLFNDTWWATHFIAFVLPLWRWIILLIAFIIPLTFFVLKIQSGPLLHTGRGANKSAHFIIIGITIIMGFLFIQFPIAHDNYGEAYLLQQYMDKTADEIPQQAMDEFFSFKLSPWAGQNTVMSLVTFISYFGGVDYHLAFVLLDLFFGVLFIISWLYFVRNRLRNRIWKIVMGLAGLSAPFILNFYGHIEINAPALLFNLLWLISMLSYLKRRTVFRLWGLLLLLLVCIKFHPVALLFAPAMLLLFVQYFYPDFVQRIKLFSWKRISILILTPIFFAGMLVYFFVFKDHADTRQLQDTAMEYDRLFLPLLSPDPPLDNYNMLSFNHIFDYFGEMLLWSPVILFLIVIVILFYREKIEWKQPEVLLTGLSLILFGALFFVVNPLLSMQMDWDLFAMPGPVFLVFGLVLVSQIENEKISPLLTGGSISMVILSIPFFMVHASTNQLSHRLESAGIRIYKTYYEWSNQTIRFALDIAEEDNLTIRKRKRNVLAKLEPYAIPGKDYEYARLLVSEGEQVLRDDQDYIKALEIFDKVNYYYPLLKNNVLYQLEAHFLLKQMDKAYEYGLQLIELKHPDERTATRITIHSALEAGFYDEAFKHSGVYVNKWGTGDVIGEVYFRLQQQDKIEELKFLFNRGN